MRKDLQKDRPPPLRIHRPPLHHQQKLQQQRGQEQQQQPFHTSTGGPPPQCRQPVIIIHTYSPEVIHTDSRNFMQLVQRLTGPGSPHVQQGQPPPAKRARLGISSSSSGGGDRLPPFAGGGGGPSIRERNRSPPSPLPLPLPSPRGVFPRQPSPAPTSPLAHHPLLSPSTFDFSPSVLPSPSALTFDFSPLPLLAGAPMQLQQYAPSCTPTLGLSSFLPSPGPLSMTSVFADLPSLSPAA